MKLLPFGFLDFTTVDLIEVLIIATALFFFYRALRGTYAIRTFLGLVALFALNALVSYLGLNTINFLLRNILDVGIIALIIIFQPEVRQILTKIGQNRMFGIWSSQRQSLNVIDEVIDAVKVMTKSKTGALIVFARGASMQDLIDRGIELNADVTSQLILTIFNKETPLHDGAVIIRGNKIIAASCYLPISQNPNISSVFGTRHRAALGISENNAVFVVVVSEETGRISIAKDGKLTSGLTIQNLRQEMVQNLSEQEHPNETPSIFKNSATEKAL